MGKILSIVEMLIDKVESDITLELDDIVYSKKHGHNICVMHIVGKNIFPKMTAKEILSNPKAMMGLSKEDIITITKLDMEINLRKNKKWVLDHDVNGIITVEDEKGEIKKYSEKYISSDPHLLDSLPGRQSWKIGYKTGFNQALSLLKSKKNIIKGFFSIFKDKMNS